MGRTESAKPAAESVGSGGRGRASKKERRPSDPNTTGAVATAKGGATKAGAVTSKSRRRSRTPHVSADSAPRNNWGTDLQANDPILAERARSKRAAGKKPTRDESAALRRVEKAHTEEQWRAFLQAIPKGLFCDLASRPYKVVADQSSRHGAPTDGRTVNLFAWVKWVFDHLAKNQYRLRAASDEEAESDSDAPGEKAALERKMLRLKIGREQLRLERERGEWIARATVHEGFGVLATVLRRSGEQLKRQCGPEAHGILNESLDELEREFERMFSVVEAESA